MVKMDDFIFEKKTKTGFLISITFQDSEKKNGNNISCEEMLQDPEVGKEEIDDIFNLLFDYVESLGIPSPKTTFYTPKWIYNIIHIGIVKREHTPEPVIHFNLYCWG